jgi:hypothetical protein
MFKFISNLRAQNDIDTFSLGRGKVFTSTSGNTSVLREL